MVDVPARAEEDQITGAAPGGGDMERLVVLGGGRAWELLPGLLERVLREARAVELVRSLGPVAVRGTLL
jgi:hypothetical protein